MAQNVRLPGYETTVITRSDLSDEGLKTLVERVNGIIASFGGEVILSEDWGKKRFAYPIEKEARGHYSYVAYTGKPGVVHEIERNLRIHDHVLRFLSVNLDKELDPAAYMKRREEMKEAAKKRDEERAARREERMAARGGDDRDHHHSRRMDSDESHFGGSDE
jgi:small subunit ribosomal protein S6